jgi:hypothetical protein
LYGGCDDRAERSTDNDCYRQINHIATQQELLEIINEPHLDLLAN